MVATRDSFRFDPGKIEAAQQLFAELPRNLQVAALRPVLLSGARVFRDALRAAAPQRTGRLRKGIVAIRHKRRPGVRPPQTEDAATAVGLTPYTIFVERNNPFFIRTVRQTSASAGSIMAREFTRRAARTAERLVARFGTR